MDYGKLSDGQVTVYAAIAECVQEGERQAEYISLAGMDAEEIRTVVMASSTLPMLYESVTYNDKEYCDGGLADNVPVKPLYDNYIAVINWIRLIWLQSNFIHICAVCTLQISNRVLITFSIYATVRTANHLVEINNAIAEFGFFANDK